MPVQDSGLVWASTSGKQNPSDLASAAGMSAPCMPSAVLRVCLSPESLCKTTAVKVAPGLTGLEMHYEG